MRIIFISLEGITMKIYEFFILVIILECSIVLPLSFALEVIQTNITLLLIFSLNQLL